MLIEEMNGRKHYLNPRQVVTAETYSDCGFTLHTINLSNGTEMSVLNESFERIVAWMEKHND